MHIASKREYQEGVSWEIYVVPLSRHFVGCCFVELAYFLHSAWGVCLFGLKVSDMSVDEKAGIINTM
jgi:hypothetical protein